MLYSVRYQVNHKGGDDCRPPVTLYLGDVGVRLEILVLDVDGMPVDLADVDDLVVKFRRPDRTSLDRTADFATDGRDGLVVYTFSEEDLEQVGTWHFTLSTGSTTWEPQAFAVHRVLPV